MAGSGLRGLAGEIQNRSLEIVDSQTVDFQTEVPTLTNPSGAFFPNMFFKNEYIVLQNQLKLKTFTLPRRGGSDGARHASLCSVRW